MDVEKPKARRLRRRATDRVEDAAAWLLIALGLFVGVLAIGAGRAGHAQVMDRARSEAAERTMVNGVLLESSAVVATSADGASVPHQVKARWIGRDGKAVVGEVPIASWHPAGATIQVWLDRDGAAVGPPLGAGTATAVGLLEGVGTAVAGWAALALAWWGVRRTTSARNEASWEREWACVEPAWSGRVP